MDREHLPVLLEEVIGALMVSPHGAYVDGTFGRGGHSTRILEALSAQGSLMALDHDPSAAESASRLAKHDQRFSFKAANFRALSQHVELGSLQGVLLDLGVSSPQLDDPERGFSFSHDGPLDMRMNPDEGRSAAEWLAEAPASEIATVLRELGEERFARRIANAIVAARSEQPIRRTGQLAEVVSAANPKWEKHKHPATRSFQAIRLHVNGELDALRDALQAILLALAPGGRMVVISFHLGLAADTTSASCPVRRMGCSLRAASEIATVLRELGEERFARRIANAIVAARSEQPIRRTGQLAEVVSAANPKWEKHKHPATRSFQAIRLHVNGELDALRDALQAILLALAPGGRMVVISFHSLEDRIVKRFIRAAVRGPQLPPGVPIRHAEYPGLVRQIGKAVMPTPAEVSQNPRARSAVMRIAERL